MLILVSTLSSLILISGCLLALAIFLRLKSFIEEEKGSPFECGFAPQSVSRNPFSVHFFLLSIIFLIFDIELILLFPYILKIRATPWTRFLFLLVLILLIYGALLEWSQKILDWLNFL